MLTFADFEEAYQQRRDTAHNAVVVFANTVLRFSRAADGSDAIFYLYCAGDPIAKIDKADVWTFEACDMAMGVAARRALRALTQGKLDVSKPKMSKFMDNLRLYYEDSEGGISSTKYFPGLRFCAKTRTVLNPQPDVTRPSVSQFMRQHRPLIRRAVTLARGMIGFGMYDNLESGARAPDPVWILRLAMSKGELDDNYNFMEFVDAVVTHAAHNSFYWSLRFVTAPSDIVTRRRAMLADNAERRIRVAFEEAAYHHLIDSMIASGE